MLKDIKLCYLKYANKLSNWEELSISDLANAYIENEGDEQLRDVYFSCIMLKTWRLIGYAYKSLKSLKVTIENCYDLLVDAVNYVLKNRVWRDPTSSQYMKDELIDGLFTQRVKTLILIYVRDNSRFKRKVFIDSILFEDIKASIATKFKDTQNMDISIPQLEDSFDKDLSGEYLCKDIIQYYLNANKELNALILNTICFSDVINLGKRKLVIDNKTLREQILNSLNQLKVIEEFNIKDIKSLNKAYAKIEKSNPWTLAKYVRDTLNDLRANQFVLDLIK